MDLAIEGIGSAGRAIRFEVADTGPGIDEEARVDLFNPFYQVDESFHRPKEGIGLGLAIARELVTMMGGEIGVDSVPGELAERLSPSVRIRRTRRPIFAVCGSSSSKTI